MTIHDNLLEFDQPTFERAIEILESMKVYTLRVLVQTALVTRKKGRRAIIMSYINARTVPPHITVSTLAERCMCDMLRTVFR